MGVSGRNRNRDSPGAGCAILGGPAPEGTPRPTDELTILTRIAILADVHGNMPALRAVLRDLESTKPDEVLVAGDLVGRGPEGRQVVATVMEREWASLKGNHEDYLLGFLNDEVPAEWRHEKEWAASRWMADQLGPAEARFISELPPDLEPRSASGVRIFHGSPKSNNDGLGPWSSDRRLAKHLESIDETLLVCAHTHRPMDRRVTGGRVVNVGSVGLPFNGDRRAQYALFTHDDRWSVEFRAVDYDIDELLDVYETSGFLEAGGVTAELLSMEVRNAVPFLVPFLRWSRLLECQPDLERIPEFLDFYDPNEPLHDFFMRLEGLRSC